MSSHATLPLEVRLLIYEKCLADWHDAPGIGVFPSNPPFSEIDWSISRRVRSLLLGTDYVRATKVKLPVPAALQSEAGDVRSRLLKWLVKHRGIRPDESAPVLRFRDRAYIPEHDFLYLDSPANMETFSDILRPRLRLRICSDFGRRIRRIALPASICYAEFLPLFLFLQRLDTLPNLRQLAFAFVELDRGELKFIESVPKNDPATYTLEQLKEGDIGDYRRKLSRSIEGLDAFIRPMLLSHARSLNIIACKMIPRC